ncbi:MAG: hypothetical protein CMN58_02055 [Solibacterales bacterium]|nr:hypothetical protein [Bryobacterales bacterium]|tara:strand:+ start:10211 stop:11053 length:843 start_codon:yes stop_codon:yes gene_type:complete
MKFSGYYWSVLVSVFLALFGAKDSLAQTKIIDLRDPAFASLGAPLFAKNCAVGYCHGSEGAAGQGPRLRGRHWNSTTLFEVIRDGIPNTTMPGWSGVLNQEGIWSITAYIIGLGTGTFEPASGKLEMGERIAAKELSSKAKRGRALFFDLTNEKRCALCHRIRSRGSTIGPELTSTTSTKSVDELHRDITDPSATIARGFEQTIVLVADGEQVSGIKKDSNEERIQLYDTAALPSPLRTFYRNQIRGVSGSSVSSMPTSYGEMYSPSELADIIAFIKSGE